MNDRSSDYVFLSYSHKDHIDALLAQFGEHGYNIVYDDALSYGDEWDLNVRRYISSEKCRGVIFFMSESAIVSKAILTEVEYTQKFRKPFFTILPGNQTFPELHSATRPLVDDNKRYIMDCIMEAFSPEQLFVKMAELSWERVGRTFQTWDFHPETREGNTFTPLAYTSELMGEKKRLENQQKGYYAFDRRAIDMVLDELEGDDLCVVDLGCSNGALTISRFADLPRVGKVIGVDYNQRDIDEANAAAQAYGDKFSFCCVDLEDEDIVEKLSAILEENGRNKADIIFSALVLHHLKSPSKLLLRLYEIMADDAKIIVRGSDDGGKLCYPKTELLQEILERYGKLVNTSDRANGRKLYRQLYDAGYVNIRMLYSCVDTCEKDRRSREHLFDVGFSFRLNRIDDLLRKNPDNVQLKQEREWFAKALSELKAAFVERSFWYCNTSYIAIAGVK